MHIVATTNTSTNTHHVILPTDYRVVVLARRIAASDAVTRIMCELAFGTSREHSPALPASIARQMEARS